MPALDLEPATRRLSDLVAGVSDDQLAASTPCELMSVAMLLDHLHSFAVGFDLAARKAFDEMPEGGRPPKPEAEHLPADWREAIPARLAELAKAWSVPDVWTGMTKAGSIDLPGEVCGVVALDEIVLHSWDLATATGQPFAVDPDHLEAIHGFVASFQVPDGGAVELFGPWVPVPDDAPLIDQTLGLAGRDPAWSR